MPFENAHSHLRKLILIGQFFGIMPLGGLGKKQNQLTFRWTSAKVVYTFLIVATVIGNISFFIFTIVETGQITFRLATLTYYINNLATLLLFVQIAAKWPKLMKHWFALEQHMNKRYKMDKGLSSRLKIVEYIFMVFGILEYLIALSGNVYEQFCVTRSEGLEGYMRVHFDYWFERIPYDHFYAILLFINNTMCNVIWNYLDLFIIVVSICLASKFKEFSDELLKIKLTSQNLVKNPVNWAAIRLDYNRICNLCYHVDDVLSNVILLSYANNMSFVLIQLFNGFRQIRNPASAVYFIYSFVYVVMRAIAVNVFAAMVNEESKKPTLFLFSIPSEVYNEEIDRLIYQISLDMAVLTGHKMFEIRRGIVLSVAAAIVTYELVLLQFYRENSNISAGPKDFCQSD